ECFQSVWCCRSWARGWISTVPARHCRWSRCSAPSSRSSSPVCGSGSVRGAAIASSASRTRAFPPRDPMPQENASMDKTSDVVEVSDPALLRLIDADAPIEQLCTGFRFSEGPLWNPREQCLYFSDMPSDIRRRWSPREGVVEVRNPSNKCNGMTYDSAGNLYVCEHVTSSLIMETPAGERKVLATHWQGKELSSPNH